MSRDPLGIWGDPGQVGNGQSYCGNNPVNRRDPFGLQDEQPEVYERRVHRLFPRVLARLADRLRALKAKIAERWNIEPSGGVEAQVTFAVEAAIRVVEGGSSALPSVGLLYKEDVYGAFDRQLGIFLSAGSDEVRSLAPDSATDDAVVEALAEFFQSTLLHEFRHYLQTIVAAFGGPVTWLLMTDRFREADACFWESLISQLAGEHPGKNPEVESAFDEAIDQVAPDADTVVVDEELLGEAFKRFSELAREAIEDAVAREQRQAVPATGGE